MLKEFDKNDHPDSIYYLLKHMEFSWITSQSKHPKKSQQAQDNFKNLKLKRSLRSLDI
nr:winged helix-turn-helix domain-containing protein [Photobacterium phosphoreum]